MFDVVFSGQFISFYSSVLGANMFKFYLLDVTEKIKYLLGKNNIHISLAGLAFPWLSITASVLIPRWITRPLCPSWDNNLGGWLGSALPSPLMGGCLGLWSSCIINWLCIQRHGAVWIRLYRNILIRIISHFPFYDIHCF